MACSSADGARRRNRRWARRRFAATDRARSDKERIDFAFRRAVSRPPTEKERTELLALLEKQAKHISEGWVSASELASGKSDALAKLPANTTPTQLAAYTIVSRVLLNLDETITKE